MRVTRQSVRDQLLAYLNGKLTRVDLVNWAENALCEGELEESNLETLRDILARLGLADVQAFGLTWDDCTDFLARLGYHAEVRAVPIAA
jgi:hypothetical protein